jgi:hypothetical protein
MKVTVSFCFTPLSQRNYVMTKKKVTPKPKSDVAKSEKVVTISAPNLQVAVFKLRGTSPYVQERFSEKAKRQMREKMEKGDQPTRRQAKRGPKDFKAEYEGSMYHPVGENWPNGAIPATQIKAAMVGACRLVDFKMTDSKQCVKVLAEGYDVDGTPLFPITKGKPEPFEQALPNANGKHDLRVHPKWDPGWEATVRIQYDADRFTADDVGNLLLRAGTQSGIGAGREASRKCVGLGWGAFIILE